MRSHKLLASLQGCPHMVSILFHIINDLYYFDLTMGIDPGTANIKPIYTNVYQAHYVKLSSRTPKSRVSTYLFLVAQLFRKHLSETHINSAV